MIIGLIISVLSNDAARGFEPLVGLMLGAFFFYMAFEAYHTARRRQLGLVVDEFPASFRCAAAPINFRSRRFC